MSKFNPSLSEELAKFAMSLANQARKAIVDGQEIATTVFLLTERDRKMFHIELNACNESEKEEETNKIRQLAKEHGCDYAITIAESWATTGTGMEGRVAPSKDPNREEVLLVLVETKIGNWHSFNKITRYDDSIEVENKELVYAGFDGGRFTFIDRESSKPSCKMH